MPMAGIKPYQAKALAPAHRRCLSLLFPLLSRNEEVTDRKADTPYPPAKVTVNVRSASALLTFTLTRCPGTVRSIR
jgi:hypothetical protein